jgi:hypothetical protein
MTPHEAADKKVEMASLYSTLSEQLERILETKPKEWIALRSNAKSAKEADRLWEGSEMGISEMKLKMKMDRVEKEISALNSFIRVSENEARQLY